MSEFFFMLGFGLILLFALQLFFVLRRYVKCPPDKMIVISGRVSPDPNQKFLIHTSGAVFVWPIIQEYELMDIGPEEIEISGQSQWSNNRPVSFKMKIFTRISQQEVIATKAVELFYGKNKESVQGLVKSKLKNKIENEIYKISESELEEGMQSVKRTLQKIITDELLELGMEFISMQEVELK